MTEVTVTCGCGRRMVQRGIDPRGTLTCGCGARVRVEVTTRPQCAWLVDERQCGFVPIHESAGTGFPVCAEHYEALQELKDLITQGETARHVLERAEDILLNGRRRERERWAAEDAERAERMAAQSVVYYVRIGDCIKIGTTVNMTARMGGLMPDEILATEPGGRELEQMRHKQFADLRVRGERFRPGPELLSHIEMVRDHFGEPVMTGYKTVFPVKPVMLPRVDGTPTARVRDVRA